jgi:hypothetical protein
MNAFHYPLKVRRREARAMMVVGLMEGNLPSHRSLKFGHPSLHQ